MATGWAHEGAVLEQIEDTITDGVLTARARLPAGEGTEHCVECGEEIPSARRRALPGATTCVSCQSGATAASSWPGSTGAAARTASSAKPCLAIGTKFDFGGSQEIF
jgi:phage/conjugal plasmid C-4 type zinc finger TraR family protein